MNKQPALTAKVQPAWIWVSRPAVDRDSHALFRGSFDIGRLPGKARLRIAADTDFVAWLNGIEIGRGQFSDFAGEKTYSSFDCSAALRSGANALAIRVFHAGEDFFQVQAGVPGVIAWLDAGGKTLAATGAGWRGMLCPAFRQGHAERMTMQCGYTFQYDARRELPWTSPRFADSRWPRVRIQQEGKTGAIWKSLAPRPLPSLELHKLRNGRIVQQGHFIRTAESESIAASMSTRALRPMPPAKVFAGVEASAAIYAGAPQNPADHFARPRGLCLQPAPRTAAGTYLLLDLGEETVGLLEFEVTAKAGTIIDIAHGEHLDDGRVRMKIDARNFADRYICRAGRQHFQMPFRRLGARFLEVHVCGNTRDFAIHAFGLRPVEYPTPRRVPFVSADSMETRIYQTAVRTLELCRHEHYEDCPWREQALYAYDGRLQALFGYHAFKDYRFPAVSFSLLAKSQRDDGWLALTAPGRVPLTIPIFSFTWIAAVAEHWQYSGAPVLWKRFEPVVRRILQVGMDRPDARTGLFHPPRGAEHWHFYEWTPGLCGRLGNDNLRGTHHAAYNLHLLEALNACREMLANSGQAREAAGIAAVADALRGAIHAAFWDAAAGHYRSELTAAGKPTGAHELIQALALATGAVPKNLRKTLRDTIRGESLARCTLSAAFYLVLAMNAPDADAPSRRWLDQRLRRDWEPMILRGATAMWETSAGGDDFDYAGSLCHGWSALPVLYYQTRRSRMPLLQAPAIRQANCSVSIGSRRGAAGIS